MHVLIGHGAAGQLGAVEIQPCLKHTVGQQVVKPRIGPLDNQRFGVQGLSPVLA